MGNILNKLSNNMFFGIVLTLVAFEIGKYIFKKTKMAILNPLLVATILIIIFLELTKIPVKNYSIGGDFILFFLAPTTVLLAVPLYEEFELLKKHIFPVLTGGIVGAITAIVLVMIFGKILGINRELLMSLIPKSITTPIGIEVSKMLGGIPSITVFAIVITGITGSVTAHFVYKMFKIQHPVAKGLGLGIASHALGTTKAIEMGEVEGAMSALSIIIAGIITLIIAPLTTFFI